MISQYDNQVVQQRKAFMAVFAFTLMALVAMLCVYVARQRAFERIVVRRDAIKHELQLAAANQRQRPMERIITSETARNEDLAREWEQLRLKVDTFRGSSPLVEALSPDAEGRIDFKVALYDARDRLEALAAKSAVTLPANLGMQETIGEDEEIEMRIWQLAAVVRLIESCIAHDVSHIEALEVLSPSVYPLLEEEHSVAIEYPVRITLQCQFDKLVKLLAHMDSAGSFFAVRGCKVALLGAAEEKPLSVMLVAGAVNFQMRGEHDAVISSKEEPGSE